MKYETCIRLRGRFDGGPLWDDSRQDDIAIALDSLPLSGGLRTDIARWATEFSCQFGSVDTESQTDQRTAASGRVLAARLNAELGHRAAVRFWHDPPVLADVLSPVNRVEIVKGSTFDPRARKRNETLASTRDPAQIARLLQATAVRQDAQAVDLITLGDPTLAFLHERTLVATTSLVGFHLRSPLWAGDFPLTDGRLLVSLLRELDVYG